jgi:hypothetical protein
LLCIRETVRLGIVQACALTHVFCCLLAASPLWFSSEGLCQTKQIRLRSETLTTSRQTNSYSAAANALAASSPVSGLFLIQAEGRWDASLKARLSAQGVQLLTYVPDDAFIARFDNVSITEIKALDFVRWVGPYNAAYKIHPRLEAAVQPAAQTNQLLAVQALLSPTATLNELAVVRALFSAVSHESRMRQGTFLHGVLPPASLQALAESPAVLWLERAPKRKLVDELASKIVGGDDGQVGTPTLNQQLGFDGSGVTVCVADTGLDTGDTNTMHLDLRGRVVGFIGYGSLTNEFWDGYGHGTHVAGIVAGNGATGETDPDTGALYGLGIASGANLLIERIFDDDATPADPFPSDQDLARDAVRRGAKIGSNSWGNDVQGEYDADAAAFDELVRDADPDAPGDQPYILEFSAGNAGSGTQTIGSPATGKNVLATGASQNIPGTLATTYGLYADGPDVMADFSSRGPCEDGRIKPDVVAPGTWIASLASSYALDLASTSWSPIDDLYVYMGGTSMSGPYAAGAAAVFVQFYRSTHAGATPSPALVKAALINSANPLDDLNGGPGPIPNQDEGWGRITLTNIIATNINSSPRFYTYLDQTVLLSEGQDYVTHVLVQSSDQPLKITLAYTDVPGFPGAIPALVNDLDLEVTSPDGTLYRGNQFAGYDSVPNAPSSDALNNVEAVHLSHPATEDYLVRVHARNIVLDACRDTAAADQDFALVISGDLARPAIGQILMNRSSYTAPDIISLSVFDTSRASSNTISVLVKSGTEPAGELVTLLSSGHYGIFTGAVATVAGSAVADGRLQVHHGDSIEADYFDSRGVLRTAMAVADLIAPTISNVTVTTNLGIITISWQTSEPANSFVRYGTNLVFSLVASDLELAGNHSLKLSPLIAGRPYSFYVTSSDAAGNTATNSNLGAWFNFVGIATPTALLVDAYEQASGSPLIEDSAYTNAIVAAGFSFAHWKVLERGGPQLADLQPYPVVIWRVTDDAVNYGVSDDLFGLVSDPSATNNTLSVQQQSMLQTYLNGGGSLFMSSMGILSQLGNVSFRKNVLQVAGFAQNPEPLLTCPDCDEDHGVPAILGVPGNPISSGVGMVLDYSSYPSLGFDFGDLFGDTGDPGDLGDSLGPDFSDTFTPTPNATPLLLEATSGKVCGISYPRLGVDNPGRVVFLSFPIDTLPAAGVPPNSEAGLMRNILNFLAPGANGAGTVQLDRSVYSIPDLVIIEMADSDLAGTAEAQVICTASSSTNQVTVSLQETTRPGLFRGFLPLVAANADQDQLTVRNGDVVTVKYYDASNHSNTVVTAGIDTSPPVISQVGAVATYDSAVVSWLTSKPSDSLVQFGESVFLGRTAYDSAVVTNHSVTVSGLLANRTYLYQVTSRDSGGNAAIDDNSQALYSFSTGHTPTLPFSDNFENGQGGWTVVPVPYNFLGFTIDTELNWSLGEPNNGLQTGGHSGQNAWGSNLGGQEVSVYAGSALYSPPLDLSGFTQITLTFWHCCNFGGSDDGQVCVSTNSHIPPNQLPYRALYQDVSEAAWKQETVNLSAFAGQTIQVVWFYEYQNPEIFSPAVPQGWLIDDVEITGVAGGGAIVVTKNLGPGTFTIKGPITRSGAAQTTTITNAPEGAYTVQFSDVTFFQTPPDQSGTLTNGGTLTFSGNYNFVDLNQNGISDAWERYYFGVASASRTRQIDTDGDGMSDYAEFIAGTNPTNPASKLTFLSTTPQTNRLMQLKWSAVASRVYLVEASTDLAHWAPITGWMQAVASPMSYTVTNSGSGARFYRVQVSIDGVLGSGTVTVLKNLSQGSFTLSGPMMQTGDSLSATFSNASPGQYSVHFSAIPFYQTPPDQTATITNGGSLTFTGNYSFTDVNHNGISDAWETNFFGSAASTRTQLTDSDLDGFPDYAEFIAGTDPTNAASKLTLSASTLTNRLVEIRWTAVPGRSYQLLSSTNLVAWSTNSEWLQASGSPMSVILSAEASGAGAARFYRVSVRP